MKIKVEMWPISKLIRLKDLINKQPLYQRGQVWTPLKHQLLIDSILRDFDIPKIYLRKLDFNAFQYEVADGQQRLDAILGYYAGKFSLSHKNFQGLDLSSIKSNDIGKKHYLELNQRLKKKFDNYKLTIAVVKNATNEEIRTLFGRLQMGNPLNPPEKRNAILCKIGTEINNIALNHQFFADSNISERRYRRQDFVAHVLGLMLYENKYDLKADLLLKLYTENGSDDHNSLIDKTVEILNHMHQIDNFSKHRIINKWTFVDFFWFIFNKLGTFKKINYQKLSKDYDEFETIRLANMDDPKKLLSIKDVKNRIYMYDYINSFKYNGSFPKSITTREKVFSKLFNKYLV